MITWKRRRRTWSEVEIGKQGRKDILPMYFNAFGFFFFSNQIGNQIFILIGSKFICSSWKFPVLPATAIDK